MKFITRKAFLFVLIFTVPIVVFTQQEKPETFANRFYKTYLKLRVRGLPDKKELRVLALYLDNDLQRLFEKAKLQQKEYIKKNPDNKPPWMEGDMFTNVYEGAQSFKLGKAKRRKHYAEISVSLKYAEGNSIHKWNNKLVLLRSKAGWRVRNILFEDGYNLRQTLEIK